MSPASTINQVTTLWTSYFHEFPLEFLPQLSAQTESLGHSSPACSGTSKTFPPTLLHQATTVAKSSARISPTSFKGLRSKKVLVPEVSVRVVLQYLVYARRDLEAMMDLTTVVPEYHVARTSNRTPEPMDGAAVEVSPTLHVRPLMSLTPNESSSLYSDVAV